MSSPVMLSSVSRRATASRARSPSPVKIPDILTDRAAWVFYLTAVVVFVVVWAIVHDHHMDVHAWARVPSWISNPFILALLFLGAALLVTYATHQGHLSSFGNWRNLIGGTFFVVGISTIAVTFLVYRSHNFIAAFYVALVVAILLVLHFYAVWIHNRQAALAVLPFLIFILVAVYFLWYMADETKDCLNVCSPVFEVPEAVPTILGGAVTAKQAPAKPVEAPVATA